MSIGLDSKNGSAGGFPSLPPLSEDLKFENALDLAAFFEDRFPWFRADETWTVVSEVYPVRAAWEYLELIRAPELTDPVFRQVAPSGQELLPGGGEDVLGEEEFSPLSGLYHRYPNRALLIPTSQCFMRCRHCMRKRLWSDPYGKSTGLNPELLERWRSYLASQPELEEVILSGGDPLTMSDHNLDYLLESIVSIPQITKVRIHTRAPVVAPSRITPELAAILSRNGVARVVTQINHPVELSEKTLGAAAILSAQGIRVENQAVLLKGVNDDPAVLAELFSRVFAAGIRPYYLHHPDPVKGAIHFTLSLAEGWEIFCRAREMSPPGSVPEYMIDFPGRGQKSRVEEIINNK